jgi:hypothetical protein
MADDVHQHSTATAERAVVGNQCPSCSSALVRPADPDIPELLSFKCSSCGLAWTEYASDRHSTLDNLIRRSSSARPSKRLTP